MLPGCPASHLSAGYPPARVGTPDPNDTRGSSRAEGSIPSVRRERFHPFEWTPRPLLFKGGVPLKIPRLGVLFSFYRETVYTPEISTPKTPTEKCTSLYIFQFRVLPYGKTSREWNHRTSCPVYECTSLYILELRVFAYAKTRTTILGKHPVCLWFQHRTGCTVIYAYDVLHEVQNS